MPKYLSFKVCKFKSILVLNLLLVWYNWNKVSRLACLIISSYKISSGIDIYKDALNVIQNITHSLKNNQNVSQFTSTFVQNLMKPEEMEKLKESILKTADINKDL